MKQLLLIRHAKSSWENSSQKDFDRTLNERGKRDAPEMAKRLLDKKIKIDAFFSSNAKRAIKTCTYFIKAYGKKAKDIIEVPELYEAVPNNFLNVINDADNEFESIAIFSHNPGITAFANQLTEIKIDNMPTCSIFAVKAETQRWKGFQRSEKTFLFFDYPKSH